jgi:hypothetical protein
VNRIIMWWDDGRSSKTYYGLENSNYPTTLTFSGQAKVTPNVTVGFLLVFSSRGAASLGVNQWDADSKNSGFITPLGAQPFTGNNADPPFDDARYLNLWIEDDKLGRVTLGRANMAGAVTTIDLAGISAGASASLTLINGGFLLRGPAGQYYAMSWNRLVDPASSQARMNEVRYTSPVIGGFDFVSSLAEDGADWGTMLLYANEVNGWRVAGGIGYEHYGQLTAQAECFAIGSNPCANTPGSGPEDLMFPPPNVNAWGVGLAALHLPTGLFAQGHFIHVDYDENHPTTLAPTGFWGQSSQGRIPAGQWLIQGGITKNWFGLGNTSVFGEYSRNSGWGASGGPLAPAGLTYSAVTTPGAQTVFGVRQHRGDDVRFRCPAALRCGGQQYFSGWSHVWHRRLSRCSSLLSRHHLLGDG